MTGALASVLFVLELPVAVWVSLPAIADAWAAARILVRGQERVRFTPERARPHLVFLVPAHDESLLIGRCVRSLLEQDSGPSAVSFEVIVIADHCSDDTAAVAASFGARVLTRRDESPDERGKGRAIAWALRAIESEPWDAVVIVDADTIVERSFAEEIARCSPLRDLALQTYDGMSNEFENWLTRLNGVLTRNRYGIAYEIKRRAGLAVPLTGDGTILGRNVVAQFGWPVVTITEGWELYALYTLEGVECHYVPRARLYAQEAKSLSQSGSQRARWTSGRLAVFRRFAPAILRHPSLAVLQRVDLLAELSNTGPIMRAALGATVASSAFLLPRPFSFVISTLGVSGVLQPALYTLISLSDHPQLLPTLRAFLRLPGYAIWRVVIGIRSFGLSGTGRWVRTLRHLEEESPPHK